MSESKTESIPNQETKNKPPVLWRGFTVNPNELSIEMFNKPLIPVNFSKEDPTKMLDGNENGVYMSTNKVMSERAYTNHSLGLFIETPKHYDRGSFVDRIKLPQCGVILEINTKGLNIRTPQITSYLEKNNGYEGDEYIADEIPPENYRVAKLVLKISANDPEQYNIDVSDNENLGEAIIKIKAEFELRKQEAINFKEFLESIGEKAKILSDHELQKKFDVYKSSTVQ